MNANEKIKVLWTRAISGTMCRLPCSECRDILGDNYRGCPMDDNPLRDDVSKKETYAFIKKVTDILCARLDREEYLPFPVDLSEEDIVNMIIEAAETAND